MILTRENDIYIQFLGGASEVGATSVFVYWKGTKILIDSGKRRGSKDLYPIFDEIEDEVDIFILTHLHQDHVGSFLECCNSVKIKKILTSRENKEILRAILKDSQKFQKDNEELLKIYSDENIEKIISKIEILDFHQPMQLKNLKIIFYKTSHLMGSLGISLESSEYHLFVTSDFTESQKFFHPKTTFISKLSKRKIDTVVTETTYGNNDAGDEVLKENCLKDLSYAINTTFKKGGNIIIPCFAIGRMQEVLIAILRLIITGDISADTQIYLNGKKNEGIYSTLGMKITEKYFSENFHILKEELSFGKRNYLEMIDTREKKEIFNNILRKKFFNIKTYRNHGDVPKTFKQEKNSIFLLQPGMLGDRNEKDERKQDIGKLALEIASGSKNGIIFVGYQSENTIGGVIQKTSYGEIIQAYGNSYIKTNKNIFKVTFPGHVSIRGVKKLIEELNPQNIILVHGDIEASKNIAETITNKNVLIPEIDEKVYLIDNNKKVFFSMQHKFSKIVVDLENKYDLIENNLKLEDVRYENYPIMKLFKNKIIETIHPKLLNFEFITIAENKIFFEKLQEELTAKGISSNIRIIEEKDADEMLNLAADLISDTNEKANLYLLSCPFILLKDFITLGEMSGADVYLYNEDNFERLPRLPYDIRKGIEIKQTEEYDHMIRKDNFQDLMSKLSYYRSVKNKKIESRYSQRPVYNVNNTIYQKNIFFAEDRSLWGEIDNIFGIKNKDVVKDLEKIYSKLNQKIEFIQMLNYVYSYDKTKEYREILGTIENKIYGRYSLENGIQYFSINLKSNILGKEIIDKEEIELYKEL